MMKKPTAVKPVEDHAAEAELLRRIAEGDRGSFEELYRRYSGVLYAAARRVLTEDADAQDVLQEVFIQIWDKARLYDAAKGKPITWALTLIRNRSIDRVRAIQRRSRLRDDAQREAPPDESTDAKEALQGVELSETGTILRNAMTQLSPEQREVIELAYFQGLTQSEIADRLGEPLGTIKARARRGMLKLKDLVEPVL